MKRIFVIVLLLSCQLRFFAQRCESYSYYKAQEAQDALIADKVKVIESFVNGQLQNHVAGRGNGNETIIKIPVVVHILYHSPEEKISDAVVQSQIDVLNKCFRRLNADTIKTPLRFQSVAADCGIEFQLATADVRRRSTSGIIKKYTPVAKWKMDDKMKFNTSMGDDAWDATQYLNIWVCNLDRLAGYSSFPGGDLKLDGLVLDFGAFGAINEIATYGQGKTAVHEIGHWMGLKHLWGDTYCGDDGVDDTPKQASYTSGCPSSIRITCGNGPDGDMYMNYMDFTNDACLNMFTKGQKDKMRALFMPGGNKHSFLNSKGLLRPLIFEIPVPEDDPKWLHPQLYPNPVSNVLNLDLSYDSRWVGKSARIVNISGQTVMQFVISTKIMQLQINKLSPGLYFIAAKREDGLSLKLQFIKL